MNQQRNTQPSDDHFTEIVVIVGGLGLSIVAANWLAASLAALVGRRRLLRAPFGTSFDALKQMRLHMDDPRRARAEPYSS